MSRRHTVRTGKPGPKSLPDAVKRRRGTLREDRVNRDAPQNPAGSVARPVGLSVLSGDRVVTPFRRHRYIT